MIITQTPTRISFLGGNTDFREHYLKHGGMVISTTIDKYIYCIVTKRQFDDLIIVNYTIKETVENINDLKHELVRECLRLLGIKRGIEISFLSDIPSQGSGLGSSSSVTIGLLNALHIYLGESVSNKQLAEEAVAIEVDILHKPIGVQDQYAIAFGGLQTIEFRQTGKIYNKRIEMCEHDREDFCNSLMLFYIGNTRKADNILSTLDIGKNEDLLNKNKILAEIGLVSLIKGQLRQFGQQLDIYWQEKKKLSNKISNPEIDKMYMIAKHAGAIGGKVIGAGGGGFLLVMFPASKRGRIRKALSQYKELPFRFTDYGSKVIYSN